MNELTDDSLMPFGKFQGKPLRVIPAEYFHYLWNNGMRNENTPMAEYIRSRIKAFKKENPDLIWD